MKNYFNKRKTLASGFRSIFVSKNTDKLCENLKLLLQEKRAGNNSNLYNEEIVPIIDKLLDYKCITPTQQKKIILKISLL